ncbi:hypothetical protein CALVIDRAFT_531614 [Calocera viscosa TUFC12733]|uniref:Uncharacterized protein n=1 Tax=Calocera viscosa (strain TUFC12733) TaxID=1330018 RepID=A0A167G554_CALVF|nr:hypothetical protein CALVIDRAFT_531614 [Calocera viscosa TUFC12733]
MLEQAQKTYDAEDLPDVEDAFLAPIQSYHHVEPLDTPVSSSSTPRKRANRKNQAVPLDAVIQEEIFRGNSCMLSTEPKAIGQLSTPDPYLPVRPSDDRGPPSVVLDVRPLSPRPTERRQRPTLCRSRRPTPVRCPSPASIYEIEAPHRSRPSPPITPIFGGGQPFMKSFQTSMRALCKGAM